MKLIESLLFVAFIAFGLYMVYGAAQIIVEVTGGLQ